MWVNAPKEAGWAVLKQRKKYHVKTKENHQPQEVIKNLHGMLYEHDGGRVVNLLHGRRFSTLVPGRDFP